MTGVFTLFLAYLIRHPHFPPLHRKASAPASLLWERSPTPHAKREDDASAGGLSPDHYRRGYAGLVSYYALFKGMAASKPTSWLFTQFYNLYHLDSIGDLKQRFGLFPF